MKTQRSLDSLGASELVYDVGGFRGGPGKPYIVIAIATSAAIVVATIFVLAKSAAARLAAAMMAPPDKCHK